MLACPNCNHHLTSLKHYITRKKTVHTCHYCEDDFLVIGGEPKRGTVLSVSQKKGKI